MGALRKIAVAVDFGELTPRALEFGRMLADSTGASLELVHVISYPLAEPENSAEQQLGVCRRLDSLLDETDRRQRRGTTACLVGPVTATLAQYATDQAIDLMVMGTHRHGPSFQMARSSVAEGVLGLAPCTVVAVKSEAGSPVDYPIGLCSAGASPAHT